MMMKHLNKVTAFLVRPSPDGSELLLIEHPHAGIQIPAGTVEPGEDPLAAVQREAREETGLNDLPGPFLLQSRLYPAPEGYAYTLESAPVYSRPDAASFCWAQFRSGLMVRYLRRQAGYAQVAFEEPDTYPDASYITYSLTGWVLESTLGQTQLRHFYRFDETFPTPPRWTVPADNHLFTLFWAPLANLPKIIEPQDQWIEILKETGSFSL